MGTIPNMATKNTTLWKQFQNENNIPQYENNSKMKKKIPHYGNNSKIG